MRFLWSFLGWLALLLSALLIAIAVVNPRREFSGGRFPALLLNTRQMKAERFDSVVARSLPAGIIIGSSRSMNLPPSAFQAVTGEQFFNFGVFGGSIDDDLAVARYVLARDPAVRDFVIGIDPQSFDSHLEAPPELTHNVRLFSAREGKLGNPWHGALIMARAYRDALTAGYLSDVVRSVLSAAHPPEPTYSFDSAGVLEYPKAERERSAGRYDFTRHFTDCSTPQLVQFAGYDSLGTSKRAMLDSLIAESTAKGVHVVLWTPPLNPALAATLRAKPVARANYDRALAYIQSLARPPLIVAVDNNDTANLPAADGWYDCMHYDASNAPAVANTLALAVRASHDSAPVMPAR